MTDSVDLAALRAEMRLELTERILPFWMRDAADERLGGTVGAMDADGRRHEDAPKGCILHARVLWSFSAAVRALGDESYREMADRSAAYVIARFVDPVHGGVFWMLDADGRVSDGRKHVYAQAFAIYALVEHHLATGDAASLAEAIAIFELVETHAHDPGRGGYEEAFSREWRLLDDVRLSAEDANERRSMNAHLHLLEAYTSLFRAWPDERLRDRLAELLTLFLDRIIAPDARQVNCFFGADWRPRSRQRSFGHDIEASWLLLESARELGDERLLERARRASVALASSVLAHGFDPAHGGVFNESVDGVLDTDKEWWPQAEAIVGFLNAYQETGRVAFRDAAISTWRFADRHMLDRRHGDWFRRTARDGEVRLGHEKIGPWKCPYHTARACLEAMARVDALLSKSTAGVPA